MFTGRVGKADSLFFYGKGESYELANNISYIPLFHVAVMNDSSTAEAKELCGDNQECLFDFSITGSKTVAAASARAFKEFVQIQEDVKAGKHENWKVLPHDFASCFPF